MNRLDTIRVEIGEGFDLDNADAQFLLAEIDRLREALQPLADAWTNRTYGHLVTSKVARAAYDALDGPPC